MQYSRAFNIGKGALNGIQQYGLDLETFSSVSLPEAGMHNYMKSEDFKILIAAIAYGRTVMVYDMLLDDNAFSDLVYDLQQATGELVAYNASFEYRALDRTMQGVVQLEQVVDAAVTAAQLGASRALGSSAAQLLEMEKMPEGQDLIKLFSVPNKRFGFKPPTREIIESDPELLKKWWTFKEYCAKDALLGLNIHKFGQVDVIDEQENWRLTERMNIAGWPVDVEMVKSFKRRYEENLKNQLDWFREHNDPEGELNLRSFPQLKKWCAERGIRTKSFDETNVEKLLVALKKRVDAMGPANPKLEDYTEVYNLLVTKKAMGGSSLSKLDTLLAQVDHETGRLHDQYMHLGAAQSYRTSGRGVQMQNLKRLASPKNIDSSLIAEEQMWTNDEMASNLRQVFRAEEPSGRLIVGDFASVESRGLAWLAGADWKIENFFAGNDMYKVLASSIYDVEYDKVDSEQRRTGKVGELSCGYGAGPGAVSSFATGMGVDMPEQEAAQLVMDWRDANPEIVDLWENLDRAMHEVIDKPKEGVRVPVGPSNIGLDSELVFRTTLSPQSLRAQHPGASDLTISYVLAGVAVFSRVFNGVYKRGRDVCYHKPTRLKTGDLWSDSFTDPKSKQRMRYKIYGGKLAGILTQSFCRELFFSALQNMEEYIERPHGPKNLKIVGQFHDEIVLEWSPEEDKQTDVSLEKAISWLETVMSVPAIRSIEVPKFPLTGEVAFSRNYIK